MGLDSIHSYKNTNN